MSLANEVEILVVEHGVLFLALLSAPLLPLASPGTTLVLVSFFLVFVYDEAFADLSCRTSVSKLWS